MIVKDVNELFERIYTPYRFDIDKKEIEFLQLEAEKRNYQAELALILLDFSKSYVHYDSFNGTKDELDDIQESCFEKLEKLAKLYPYAYKVIGELHLGKMGKIVFHHEIALEYFKKYAEATGDNEPVDNFEKISHEAWEDYKDVSHYQQTKRILERSKIGVTYSHDPLFYERDDKEDK